MIDRIISKETKSNVANYLMQIKAIKLDPAEPFTWASGWKSPIYCDNRKINSYPKIRTYIRQCLTNAVIDMYGKPDVIAGVATGAIPQGALVAQELGLPFIYVRAKAKDHGLENLIEGFYEEGQSVVVIEDLISTGQSSLNAVKALRAGGCVVKGMVSIFNYGFEVAKENFEAENCDVVSLTDYDTLISIATETGFVQKKYINSLSEWRINPANWKAK